MTTHTPEGVNAREAAVTQSYDRMIEVMKNETSKLHRDDLSVADKFVALQEIRSAITSHINLFESYIAQGNLTGANDNLHWRTYQAESALNLLEVYPTVFDMYSEWCNIHGESLDQFRPSRTSFTELQRIVAETHPNDAIDLREKFSGRGLPIRGFDSVISRLPSTGSDTASVEFSPNGGLLSVKNVKSHDAVKVATSIEHVGQHARSAPTTPHDAALTFGAEGGISEAKGLYSADAARIATGVVHQRKGGFSAPASASAAAELIKPAEPGWFARQWKELRDSPAKMAVTISCGLLVTFLVAWLTASGRWPTSLTTPQGESPSGARSGSVPATP